MCGNSNLNNGSVPGGRSDAFAIQRNIERLIRLENVDTALIAVLDVKGSVVNRKSIFAKGFGIRQTVSMGILYQFYSGLNFLDALFGYSLLKIKRSVKAVAKHNQVTFALLSDPNSESFLSQLKEFGIDLVISYSAPSIFKSALLETPVKGCINLHCSHLPNYAGLLPSFWVLYHEEETTGATVHYMDSKIDNGAILAQTNVPIDSGMSMFALIQKTKSAGGKLMASVEQCLANGEHIETKPNQSLKESTFTWPTIVQMRQFRSRGGRLI